MCDDYSRGFKDKISRYSRRKFLTGTIASVAGTLSLVTSCSKRNGVQGFSDESASKRLTDFNFLSSLPFTSLTFAPEMLADCAGIFTDHGLNVRFLEARGSAQAIQLVMAGRASITRISRIDGIRAIANSNAPIVNVGPILTGSTIRFVSSPNSPLLSPEDFVGRIIGIPSKGGSSEMELDLLLSKAGISTRNVSRQVVGLSPATFDLVESGRIDGYAVSLDTMKLLERRREIVVLNPNDFSTAGGQFYMASTDKVGDQREAIVGFISAVDEAIRFMAADDNFDSTLRYLRTKYSFPSLFDTRLAIDSLNYYLSTWITERNRKTHFSFKTSWTETYKELLKIGLAEPSNKIDDVFYSQI